MKTMKARKYPTPFELAMKQRARCQNLAEQEKAAYTIPVRKPTQDEIREIIRNGRPKKEF